jgi:hypothetical protein
MDGRPVVDGAMHTNRGAGLALTCAAALVLSLASATPALAGKQKAVKPATACQHPCAHVEDCPKVTCECANATASGVAACDTEKTHCCVSSRTACASFCEANQQKWTGRFTPEEGTSPPAPTTDSDVTSGSGPSPACEQSCGKADDCPTITCQCAHGTAPDVAACDAKAHCCGSARVVCEHYCTGAKGKWTGKLVDAPKEHDPGSVLDDMPENDIDEYDDEPEPAQ